MRRTGIADFGLAAALAMTALLAAQSPAAKTPPDSAAGKLMLGSTDISAGGQIAEAQVFNGFGCKGGNVSPALSWSNPPAGAGDPQKNLLPAGAVQGRADFGTPGYGGPCPPPGKPHHYYLRLYALKVARLDVPADATAAYIGFMVRMQSLGKAELMGVYGR